jgi:Homeodomain-like domain
VSRSKSWPVALSVGERELLARVVRTGSHPAQEVRRSRILLELDENHGQPDTQEVIAARVGVAKDTVRKVAKAYVEHDGDVQATIRRTKRLTPPVEPRVTGEVEARVIALACTAPPQGYARWSLRLLEKHVALVEGIPDLDHSTIGKILKKQRFVLI